MGEGDVHIEDVGFAVGINELLCSATAKQLEVILANNFTERCLPVFAACPTSLVE